MRKGILGRPVKMAYGGFDGALDTITGKKRNLLDTGIINSNVPVSEQPLTTGNNGFTPIIAGTNPSQQPLVASQLPPNLTPAISSPTAVTPPITGNSKLEGIGQAIAPFASNIINAFRKPAKPSKPILDSAPVLNKVDMSADRAQVSRETNAATSQADRGLNSNTAESVRQFNLGQKLNRFSQINQNERNTNTQIANQQAILNAQTNNSNNTKIEDYNNAMTERSVAQQREQSANISNATDKYIGIQNEKAKAKLDLAKAQVLAQQYDTSGVLRRQRLQARLNGLPDPLGRNYDDVKGYGGRMRPLKMS